MSRNELLTIATAVILAIATGVAEKMHSPDVLVFLLAAAALSMLAVAVGHATEQLGHRLSAGITGILQSAFGNLPELLITIFSLRAGLLNVVHAAIVGSILANLLLVMGVAITVGGVKHGTQRFASEPPKMIATLMLLAVAALSIPTLAAELHTPAQDHEAALGAAVAVVLLIVFVCSLVFSIRGDAAVTPKDEDETAESLAHAWPMWMAFAVLAVAATGAAFVSEWFVDALTPTMKTLGISETFAGLVIVAIAGNAVENLVAIKLAARNKPDYAMSVVLNSSLQIALAMTPILVLSSFFLAPVPLTLVIPPLLVAALVASAVIATVIVIDGETIWLEGVALVGLYVIVASSVWWG